jgi:TM2 domain-containing membrane protein YozV
MTFCATCGHRIAAAAAACPACGAPNAAAAGRQDPDASPRSYGVAVALCGIFGPLGLHHFYLGNVLHGLFDLALFFAAVTCWVLADFFGPEWNAYALALFAADVLHTVIVFYRLIVGSQRDWRGRLVTFR